MKDSYRIVAMDKDGNVHEVACPERGSKHEELIVESKEKAMNTYSQIKALYKDFSIKML
ncbi:hypothetical protein [Salsuginibacillus kocurii]|uniref:hypothetical protein n=1 Tax=Salsuginibacillus kocurii TaxID=427078 RepID=UPI00036AC0FA|nr:hypothetical protein [Salsuginibacillus kocurii]